MSPANPSAPNPPAGPDENVSVSKPPAGWAFR